MEVIYVSTHSACGTERHAGIEDTLSGPHSLKETLVKKQVLTKLRLVSKVKDFRSMLNMFRVGLSVCVGNSLSKQFLNTKVAPQLPDRFMVFWKKAIGDSKEVKTFRK